VAEAFPIPNKEAAVVARVLVEQVFCRFGTPIALRSDNGTEVDSSIMREVCKLLGVDKLHTTAYKVSTNSVIERFHRTLNCRLGNSGRFTLLSVHDRIIKAMSHQQVLLFLTYLLLLTL